MSIYGTCNLCGLELPPLNATSHVCMGKPWQPAWPLIPAALTADDVREELERAKEKP